MKSNAKRTSSRGFCRVKMAVFLMALILFASMELFPIMESQRDVTRATIGDQPAAKIRGPLMRVIVKLDVSGIQELTRASNAYGVILPGFDFPRAGLDADRRLEEAIGAAAGEVLGCLDPEEFRINRMYVSIPYLALSVSSASMARLAGHPRVLSVTEDILDPVSLPRFSGEKRRRSEMYRGPASARPGENNTTGTVGAERAWDMGYTGSDWYVAILDTGVYAGHEFFKGKTVVESCFASGIPGDAGDGGDCPNGRSTMEGSGAAAPYESFRKGYDHGTHAAGIAAGNNGSLFGVAKDAGIIAVQVFSRSPAMEGLSSWISDQAAGLDYIYSIRGLFSIASVNLGVTESLLWDGNCDSDVRKAAIDNLRSAGIATCIPTGDQDSCWAISSPACVSGCIPVGAMAAADEKMASSNWHPGMQKVFAPGSKVYSSLPDTDIRYGPKSGTMAAAPHVSGAWALLKQAYPGGTVDELLTALAITGYEVTTPCDGFIRGIPAIRIGEAIRELKSGSICVTSPAGSELWPAASVRRITWTSRGDVGDVNISYSTDGGDTWKPIARNIDDDGDYLWDIPDEPSEDCLVRISDADGIPRDDSDMVFAIVPPTADEITVTSPNGGESLNSGSNYAITWTSSGDIGNVDISYSTDGGDTWKSIVAGTDDDGSYEWNISDDPSDTCLVRISDAGGIITDDSDMYFSIIPPAAEITITSPNGGENLDSGTHHVITWTTSGEILNVMIEYSTDDGGSWHLIAGNTANSGSYDWIVPQTGSDECRVRITGMDGDNDPGIRDISDQVFSITSAVQGTLTLRSPNGGENWHAGSLQAVEWTSSGNIDTVGVQLSVDNGTTWKEITAATANDGVFEWTVPGTVSGECLIRIFGAEGDLDPLPSDTSDAVFAIVFSASLEVTAPNGGESLTAGSLHPIEWRPADSRDTAIIAYSLDGGVSWTGISEGTPNDGHYEWQVPHTPSDNCLVRVSEAGSLRADTSDGVFSIVQPADSELEVVSPNGGEQWASGSVQQITWTGGGAIEDVSIVYSTDNGNSWETVAASVSNNGGFDWTVPDTVSPTCRVRVQAVNRGQDPVAADVSDGVFAIIFSGVLRVTSPNGGESLTAGSRRAIEWRPADSRDKAKIEYSVDGGDSWAEIAGDIPNSGVYEWLVPDTPSENCLVRVSEAGSRQVDISDAVFAIVQPGDPDIRVTSPNGGEQWIVASVKKISWTGGNEVNNVSLEYSLDNGSTWITIRGTTENDGGYDWTVPDRVSANCRVRITAADGDPDPRSSDTSDGVFSIVAAMEELRVLEPNGGESWEADTLRTISWSGGDSAANVMIEFSWDNRITWSVINASAPNSGSYDWRVPDSVSDDCFIRITAPGAGDSGVKSDTGDAAFAIVYPRSPTVRILSPNGGEELVSGSNVPITWFSTDSRQKKNLAYSVDGGQIWREIAVALDDNGGYNWLVPDEPSDHCLIRISGEDGEPVDLSDAVFSIVSPAAGAITVLTPNGGENLQAGTEFMITWDQTGLNLVTIEYSVNSGSTWMFVDSVNADSGGYNWVVPAVSSGDCLVRITGSGADSNHVDVSDNLFAITDPDGAEIEVFFPNGGEQLTAGMKYDITWGSRNIEVVLLEYTTDNGESWQDIGTAPGAKGRYTWTVPDTPSEICRIRISGTGAAPGPLDSSDAVFTILTN